MADICRREGRHLRAAFGFLTRLPVAGKEIREADLSGSVLWFPLAGLAIGLGQGAVGWGAAFFFPPLVVAVLIWATGLMLSGGLHLDGLMDTADGLASGGRAEEILAVMRDSRVGAYGVTAALTVVLLQIAALLGLLGLGPWRLGGVLAAVGALSRGAMAAALVVYPYCRTAGLGRPFAGAGWRQLLGAAALAVGVSGLVLGWPGLVLAALAVGILLVFGYLTVRGLGGLTGDTYGALAELEVTLLLLSALILLGTK